MKGSQRGCLKQTPAQLCNAAKSFSHAAQTYGLLILILLTGSSCSLVQLEGLKQLIQPNSGWRPNFATQLRAAAMQQLRGDKLAMKAALDLILWCAYGNKSRAFPGGPPAVFLQTCRSLVANKLAVQAVLEPVL